MKLVEMEKNNWGFEEDSTFTRDLFERFDQALDTWEKGHDEVAEKMLRSIVAECPNHIDAIHHLSLLYNGQGRELEDIFIVKPRSVSDCTRFPRNSTGKPRGWNGGGWRIARS